MKITQIYEILNTIVKESLGEETVVEEDLSNIVDIGRAFENLENGYDNYVKRLHDHIGRMVFVDRVYKGRAPQVIMDGWEYGSIMEKVRADLFEAEENESWQLEDRASYDSSIFYAPKISAKFFNKKVTFEIPVSITEKQVKSSFSSVAQMNAFYSMIQTQIENSMTVKMDELVMRTINNMIGETLAAEFPEAGYGDSTSAKAVNLLYLYNYEREEADQLGLQDALRTPDFYRFCAAVIGNYVDRLEVMSNLFNVGGTSKFTPRDRMHICLLSEFARGADVYLQSETFHNELTKLPEADKVAFWQGSGLDYGFSSTSAINVVTSSGVTVDASGIVGCIFDRDALGVANLDRRVTSHYVAKAEFWNEFHKFDAGYFNDLDENFVVFYVAEAE